MSLALLVPGWLLAFALTQLVEVPIHARALRERGGSRWLLAFAASALTHPFVYLAFPHLLRPGTWMYLLVAESFAVLVEAAWLRKLGVREALTWSLVANASSVAVAAILQWFGCWSPGA